jgi:hypothetical protein
VIISRNKWMSEGLRVRKGKLRVLPVTQGKSQLQDQRVLSAQPEPKPMLDKRPVLPVTQGKSQLQDQRVLSAQPEPKPMLDKRPVLPVTQGKSQLQDQSVFRVLLANKQISIKHNALNVHLDQFH